MASNPNISTVPIIYGPDNLPIRRLTEEERFEEMLGSYDDYQAYSFRLPPYNPDVWIATKGYAILDDMMNMVAVRAPFNAMVDAVLYKGWKVDPAVNDEADADYAMASEIADAFEYALSNIVDEADNAYDFRQTLREVLYAVHTGFHVAEIDWRVLEDGPYAGKYGFRMFAHKNCRQIGFDVDKRTMAVRNITSYTPLSGYRYDIPVEKTIRYTFAARASEPYGFGIGRACYKHSWSLDFLYKFWNIAMEIFGSPFILGKAAPNAIALARKVIQEIRQGAPAVLPSGVEAELIEIAGNGIAQFKAAAEHHSQQCAYAYLGSTLTSGEGQRSGSLALGQVHQDQQSYGLGGRRRDIEMVFTLQLARRYVRYTYGDAYLHLMPSLSLGEWDGTDTAKMATAAKSLIDAQVLHPGEPQIRERCGFGPARPEDMERLEAAWNASPGPISINSDPSQQGDNPPDSGGEGQ